MCDLENPKNEEAIARDLDASAIEKKIIKFDKSRCINYEVWWNQN